MQSRRFVVRGRVQGVGFRWFVEHEARKIGVVGIVRNLEDGTVETLAAGTPQQLAELRQRLERGPRAARVDQVEESDISASNSRIDPSSRKDFSIEGAW